MKNPNSDINADKYFLDSLIVEETCLELAGESAGYFSMIRMNKRWGNAMKKTWAEKVAKKYPAGDGIRQKLEGDDRNWFIKYDIK